MYHPLANYEMYFMKTPAIGLNWRKSRNNCPKTGHSQWKSHEWWCSKFNAIIPTSFSCYLLICYPYISQHFQCLWIHISHSGRYLHCKPCQFHFDKTLMWWLLSWLLREFSDANLRSFCQRFNWMLQLSSGMFQLNSSGPDDDWSIQWNIDPDGNWNIELKHWQKVFPDFKLVLENSLFHLEDC